MNDCVNLADLIVYQRYWDNKIRVCQAYQKQVRTRLRHIKKNKKGQVGSCHLTDATIDRL